MSNDTSAILKCAAGGENITEISVFPLLPPVLSDMAAGSLDVEVLNEMFGNLSKRRVQGANSELVQAKQETILLDQPSMESIINIEKGIYDPLIACVGPDQVWIQTAKRRLQLLDREGKVKETVNVEFDVYDMVVRTQEDILLTDYNNNCIRSMTLGGRIQTLFDTELRPCGVCSLPSGDTVVAFTEDQMVVQYSSSGEMIREMDRSLFQYPWYIAYNQVNQQLYVCDKSDLDKADASGRLLVLGMDGKLQYTYTGSDTTTFTPMAVCTDLVGHVLITDYNNHTVHILDKEGNFLQYLLTGSQGLKLPLTIDVDSDGNAWIGEDNAGNVKVVKYMHRQ